ncbi:MAG: hypothetical protein M0R74_02080 [Dehalococcoidia bacterium]|nr:hypothetical protein [Dehalococcoidia bacterium]
MQLGSHSVLVTGARQVRRDMDVHGVEDLISRIDARLREIAPEVGETFWELRHTPEGEARAAEARAARP